ncbi:NrdH-redoxin [Candidatus Micrarchaeota archaeon CG1_02_55_22]|nr:MAG: NrdH-redoxin [Candidatus Micrarchaeota archaeon CG1_02_55_22]
MNEKQKVIVYSTKTCPYCVMAKDYLTSKGVPYEDVDVGSDRARAQEMVSKSGQMGVPVLDIDGKVILGFDRGAIDAALSN